VLIHPHAGGSAVVAGRASPAGVVRVLVADDSALFRAVARQVVDSTPGFELIAAAASGAQAVVLAGEHAPQLVLLDVRMPAMGGIEAAREIARRRPGTCIVLISAARRSDAPGVSATDLPFLIKSRFGPRALRNLWRDHGRRG
jgi:DNA-binding NarL/FixJ family response regulator